MATETIRIQIRRGTAAQWTSANPIMGQAEFGVETDTGKFKIGDGVTAWNDIANYFEPGATEDYVTSDELNTELSSYLTSASAASTYLTQSTATSDYLTKLAAQSTYAALSGATFSGNLVASQNLTVESDASFQGSVLLSADPTLNLQAATKQYVDNVAAGIQPKPAVIAASTTNVSGTYDNGTSGVNATLNLGQLATLDIDGVTSWNLLDGILLKDQTDATENGRWVVDQIGNDTDTDWILRRCSKCDEPSEIPGAYMFVLSGDTNVGTGWTLVVDDALNFVVGTDDITAYEFTASVSYTAGDGLDLLSNEFSVDSTVVRTSATQNISLKTISDSVVEHSLFTAPVETYATFTSVNAISADLTTDPSVSLSTVSGDFSINLTNALNATNGGQSIVYTAVINQGSTEYNLSAFQLDGQNQTVNWANGEAPTGNSNQYDVYTFVLMRNNPSSFLILGSMTSYA